MVLCF